MTEPQHVIGLQESPFLGWVVRPASYKIHTLSCVPESNHQGLTSFLNTELLPFFGSAMFPASQQRLSDLHRNCPFGIPQIHSSHPPVLGGLWPLTDFNSILKSTWRLTSGHSQDRSILHPPTAKLTLTSLSMKSTTKHNPSPATWSKRNITETAEVGRENYYETRKQVFSNLLQT